MSTAARMKRLLGWPLRRALDPRVEMTVHEIDARLGSENLARPTVHDQLDDLDRMGRDMLAGLGWRDVAEPGGDLERLDAARAAYLNWASGPEGYAAQAGCGSTPGPGAPAPATSTSCSSTSGSSSSRSRSGRSRPCPRARRSSTSAAARARSDCRSRRSVTA